MADQTETQLNQFRDRIPQDVIDRIQKSIEALEQFKYKQIGESDLEAVQKAIEEAKQSVLQIGISMNKSGNSGSDHSCGDNKGGE